MTTYQWWFGLVVLSSLGSACGDNIVPGLVPDGHATTDGPRFDANPVTDGPAGDGALDGPLDGPGGIDAVGTDGGMCTQAPVALGAAGAFAVLAGPSVTNTGLTIVTGDLGTSPGTSVTGFGPGTVVGTQHVGDATALAAQLSLTTAYNDAAGRPAACATAITGNVGGQTLPPGLYKSTGAVAVSSGDLVLDGQGNANAVFIFQIAQTFTTTGGRKVLLINGARATNVFWQVGSSATIGTTSVVPGTIMADQAIAVMTGAILEGRVLARIAGITLDTDTITLPAL